MGGFIARWIFGFQNLLVIKIGFELKMSVCVSLCTPYLHFVHKETQQEKCGFLLEKSACKE